MVFFLALSGLNVFTCTIFFLWLSIIISSNLRRAGQGFSHFANGCLHRWVGNFRLLGRVCDPSYEYTGYVILLASGSWSVLLLMEELEDK